MNEIKLTPSRGGEDCIGNGRHDSIEIQCDECDYFLECFPQMTRQIKFADEQCAAAAGVSRKT